MADSFYMCTPYLGITQPIVSKVDRDRKLYDSS